MQWKQFSKRSVLARLRSRAALLWVTSFTALGWSGYQYQAATEAVAVASEHQVTPKVATSYPGCLDQPLVKNAFILAQSVQSGELEADVCRRLGRGGVGSFTQKRTSGQFLQEETKSLMHYPDPHEVNTESLYFRATQVRFKNHRVVNVQVIQIPRWFCADVGQYSTFKQFKKTYGEPVEIQREPNQTTPYPFEAKYLHPEFGEMRIFHFDKNGKLTGASVKRMDSHDYQALGLPDGSDW
jgi:hypothetical protein